MIYEEALNMCIFGQKIDGKNYYLICDEWFDAVDRALEKQIPKKPVRDEYGVYRCPLCGDSWNANEYGSEMKFCWTCGQAIDWGKEE